MAKTVIVGAVAAGMSAATRLRRLDETAEIIVLEAGGHVSFANCGLPYFVGGVIEDRSALLLQTPAGLHARFALDVRVNSRVTSVDPHNKTVTVLAPDGSSYVETYDSLVLSPGAQPVVPDLPGAERALTLRNIEDVDRMTDAVAGAQSAVVIGAGFVGLEVAENLAHRGLAVTVVELAPQVLGPLDAELAVRVRDALEANGITVHTSARTTSIDASTVHIVTEDGLEIDVAAEVVVAAIGVRPDSSLARDAGLELGPGGSIVTDADGRSSAADVYAVGDVAAKRDALDGSVRLIPLANLANRHGRRVADAIVGLPNKGRPSVGTAIGTAIVTAFGTVAAMTGRGERDLRASGRDVRVIHTHPMSHAGYYPGAEQMTIKLIVDPATDAILGAQAVGGEGVDKRIDVIATAMAGGITASELADLELAYAPPFGSAKDAINMLGYVAENLADGLTPSVQWHDLATMNNTLLVDVRTPAEHALGSVDGAVNIPLDDLRVRRDELPMGTTIVVHCQVGQRGHTATRLLRQLGYDAVNLDGGWLTWRDGMRSRSRAAVTQ